MRCRGCSAEVMVENLGPPAERHRPAGTDRGRLPDDGDPAAGRAAQVPGAAPLGGRARRRPRVAVRGVRRRGRPAAARPCGVPGPRCPAGQPAGRPRTTGRRRAARLVAPAWLRTVRPARWWPLLPLAVLYAAGWASAGHRDPGRPCGSRCSSWRPRRVRSSTPAASCRKLLRAVRPWWRAVGVGLLFGVGHVLSGAGVRPGRRLPRVPGPGTPSSRASPSPRSACASSRSGRWSCLHAESNLLVLAAPDGAVPDAWEAFQLVVMLATGAVLVRQEEREPAHG